MANYKTTSDIKNCYYREFEDGITKITFRWLEDIPICKQTEVAEVPTDATLIEPEDFDDAANACSEYARIKSRPTNYLPPR